MDDRPRPVATFQGPMHTDLRFDFVATQAVSLWLMVLASSAACLACAGVR